MRNKITEGNVCSPVFENKSSQKRLVDYCESLRRRDPHALGFIPYSGYYQAIGNNRMLIEFENSEPCGFLIWSRRKQRLKVLMMAVQVDARRYYHATNLLNALFTHSHAISAEYIQLRCADDLESNRFWRSVGFQFKEQVDGGKLRAASIRPRKGSIEEQIVNALGIETLMKIKKKTCSHRRINVYQMWYFKSKLWQQAIKKELYRPSRGNGS